MKLEEIAIILDQKVSAIDEKISKISNQVNEYMDIVLNAPDLLATHSVQYVQNIVNKYLDKIDKVLIYARQWLETKLAEITDWVNNSVKKVTDFASLRFVENQSVTYSYQTADYSSDKVKAAQAKIVENQKKVQSATSIANSLQTASNDTSKITDIINSTSKLNSMLDRLNQVGINMNSI